MRCVILSLFLCTLANCKLWPKGVVHYDFNQKHYDPHSQSKIMEIFGLIEKEICVKFFYTQSKPNANSKILFITNPDRRKSCPNGIFNYNGTIVNMTIGYKCLNNHDVAKIVVDMLRASVYGQEIPQQEDPTVRKRVLYDHLIPLADRTFINTQYRNECVKLDVPLSSKSLKRHNIQDGELNDKNIEYYSNRIWPLGVVSFAFDFEDPTLDANMKLIEAAMNTIESVSCIQFHDIPEGQTTDNYISFEDNDGEEIPRLGVQEGKQVINIKNMTEGAPGHKSHILLNLLRILGLPLESNRADRNNYVKIQWGNIAMGKEQYFELDPAQALLHLTYDFESVLHAPVNWLCNQQCAKGGQTIQPIGDHNWSRTMTIGRRTTLTDRDISKLNLIYGHECRKRDIKLSTTKSTGVK